MSETNGSTSNMDYMAALNQLFAFDRTEKIDLKKTSQEAYEKIMENELRKGVKDPSAVNDLFKLFGIPIRPHFAKNSEGCVNETVLPTTGNGSVLKREEDAGKDKETKDIESNSENPCAKKIRLESPQQ